MMKQRLLVMNRMYYFSTYMILSIIFSVELGHIDHLLDRRYG